MRQSQRDRSRWSESFIGWAVVCRVARRRHSQHLLAIFTSGTTEFDTGVVGESVAGDLLM
jgi:hypothetical protein